MHDGFVQVERARIDSKGLKMKVINPNEGLLAIGRGERDGFRRHLAQHGIQCELFGITGARWPEGNPGEFGQPEVDRLKLVHPEELEKATELYRTWRANQAPVRSE
jgi:hypothetical protein